MIIHFCSVNEIANWGLRAASFISEKRAQKILMHEYVCYLQLMHDKKLLATNFNSTHSTHLDDDEEEQEGNVIPITVTRPQNNFIW